MKASEYASHDATALAELVSDGEVTPAELASLAIGLIEEWNPSLNAIIHPDFERARQAAAAELSPGPFRGVPFLLKDLGSGHRAGDPHHWGTRVLRDIDYRPQRDSYLVERFERAGLVILGHTNVPELGAWATTESEAYGACRNPWNLDHVSGGSSGGAAAAVAMGIVPFAHASDGGGSIRNPASQCGLVGLKPTRGRITLGPLVGEAWAGLISEFALTRTVRDCAALLDAVQGPAPGDPYRIASPRRPYSREATTAPKPLRIGVLTELDDGAVHPECLTAVERTLILLGELGHHVEESHPDATTSPELLEATIAIISSAQARDVEKLGALSGREIGPGDLDCDNWTVTQIGQQVTATRYLAALETHQAYQRRVAAWWADGFDVLVTPTITGLPPRVGEMTPDPAKPLDAFMRSGNLLAFTLPFNITGQPALSLPLHWSASGLPVGVQFIADFGREDLLVQLAAQLERATGWPGRRPPLHPAGPSA